MDQLPQEPSRNTGTSITFHVVLTSNNAFDVMRTDNENPSVKICTCEQEATAIIVQHALLEYFRHHASSVRAETFVERPAAELSDLWFGGLPNWQAQPFLPGACIRCTLDGEVTGYVYRNVSGGYTLLGPLCRSCCEIVSEQLQDRSAQLE